MNKSTQLQIIMAIIILTTVFSSCSLIQIVFARMPSHKISALTFEVGNEAKYKFVYPDTLGDLYLRQLRVENNLLQLVEKAVSDKEKALLILNWTHAQWSHSPNNTPSKYDAITILKEAKQGKSFRCVEYGIVTKTALLSIGMKARGLGLDTRDVETCDFGAGHYLSEVWLSEFNKWALIDGQFNVMPILNNVPLNAVEFQEAIIQKKPIILVNCYGEISKREYASYLNFIPHYLYYFAVEFDQRPTADNGSYTVEGKTSLMLVPLTAHQPKVFQRKYPMDNFIYTNSLDDFYIKP